MEHAARPQHAGQLAQRRRRDEAALVMPRLGPGIGIEQVDGVDGGVGQLHQELERVVGEEPHIAELPRGDGLDHLADAARKDLAADKAGRGFFGRLAGRCSPPP